MGSIRMRNLALYALFSILIITTTTTTRADDEIEEESVEEEQFDGVGIALIDRPEPPCEKSTKKGDLVRVTLNGTVGDNTGAFSTRYETEQLEFVLGDGEMIPGFDAGCVDMCVGETRHLTIPSQYAYGTNGMGTEIPARATLYFYVTLHSYTTITKEEGQKPNTFMEIDTNSDDHLSHGEVQTYLVKQGVEDVDGEAGLKHLSREIFKEEDRDQNGVIEFLEFSGKRHSEL